MTRRLAALLAGGLLFVLPLPASAARPAAPAGPAAPAAPAATCVAAQVDQRAAGVRSTFPVLQLATGLNEPDDVQVTGDVILVGQLGNGRIARLGVPTAVGGFDLLPAVVPTVEGPTGS